jgi:23S rRNA (adenine2503-C2)-methyltransferase
MGEPIFNENVFRISRHMIRNKKEFFQGILDLRVEVVHPVLTTSLPKKFKLLEERIMEWCDIKNDLYKGQAGFQFSINSTNEEQRDAMFNGMQLSLVEFSRIAKRMPDPISRKYCLNFALASGNEVDAIKLSNLFDKDKFMVKITPIHNNNACRKNGIVTVDGYESFSPYKKAEEDLKKAGFDVLIFVPSFDEEEGLVTCGNAVLGGSTSSLIN